MGEVGVGILQLRLYSRYPASRSSSIDAGDGGVKRKKLALDINFTIDTSATTG